MGDARPVLMQLIEEKLLTPGLKKLYVSYYRKRVYADLLADGSIRFKDTIYISPVPCALQMKRTLNPSLKTDAGWSTMFSAASGESLKDIKDRLNIRKRGPNSRTVNKEKKLAIAAAGGAAPASQKERASGSSGSGSSTATGSASAVSSGDAAKQLAASLARCTGCKKDASTDYSTCTACKRRTHYQCAHPPLEKAPTGSWFCDGCLTNQANDILSFLNQTRRVLASRSSTNAAVDVEEEEEPQAATDAELSASEADAEPSATDAETEEPTAESEDVTMEDKAEDADKEEAERADKDETEKADDELDLPNLSSLVKSVVEESTLATITKPAKKAPADDRFQTLLDQLIEEVSSKSERTDIITNSTGATLVHLAKTELVNLVERGLADIAKASKKSEEEEETNDEDEDDEPAGSSGAFDVDELVRLFDLRHQVLQSKQQFEHTTDVLVQRGEERLRVAENELMELEETRTTESNAVMKIANLIDQYTSDLKNCQERIRLNQVLLESVMQRRKFIRSSNVSSVFLPAYRLVVKHMITSSDQLLVTVMLDKLRDVARMVNEWEKMESHFETMSAKLQERLNSMKVKREPEDPSAARSSSPVPLFARIKIPPSRRLLERQIANYKANLKSIAGHRLRIRRTLQTTLKIAKDELLGEDVVDMTEILLKKCGGAIIVEEIIEKEEEPVVLEPQEEPSAGSNAGNETSTEEKRPREGEDAEADAQHEAKRPRVEASPVPATVPDAVKPEPVVQQAPVPVAAAAAPVPAPVISAPAIVAPVATQAPPATRVVEVLDSDGDSDASLSSQDAPSPMASFSAPATQRPAAPATAPSIQSLESVRVKKELVDQASRNEFMHAAYGVSSAASTSGGSRNEPIVQQRSLNESTGLNAAVTQNVRKTGGASGSSSVGPWESASSSMAPQRTESTYRQPSPSLLYQQVQQQQQQQQQAQQQQAQQSRVPEPKGRTQQPMVQSTSSSSRFPMPTQEPIQHHHQMPPKQQQPKAQQPKPQQRSAQRPTQPTREPDVLRPPPQADHASSLPHAFQMPQAHQTSRQPQTQQSVSRTHQLSPVRDPFPSVPAPSQSRPTQASTASHGFTPLNEQSHHQPAEFSHQRHHASLTATGIEPQGFQQQQQQQQFQRYQQQQQQQQHAGMLHGSSTGHRTGGSSTSSSHPLFGDVKPPSMTSSSIPTPQDLFGGHSHSPSSDDALSIPQPTCTQPVAASRQTHQQQQQHSYQHSQQQQQQQQQHQMLHHLTAAATSTMGQQQQQHHSQSHPLVSANAMGSQYNDPTSSMRSAFLPSANDTRGSNAFAYGDNTANHMMHHAHNDVFASHGLGQQHQSQQQQQQQQQAPSMHHLFQNDVGVGARGNANSADFQHFNSRLFRDPTGDNQMNHHPGMDPPDMSEW